MKLSKPIKVIWHNGIETGEIIEVDGFSNIITIKWEGAGILKHSFEEVESYVLTNEKYVMF